MPGQALHFLQIQAFTARRVGGAPQIEAWNSQPRYGSTHGVIGGQPVHVRDQRDHRFAFWPQWYAVHTSHKTIIDAFFEVNVVSRSVAILRQAAPDADPRYGVGLCALLRITTGAKKPIAHMRRQLIDSVL